jgi:hypothetical protein
LPACRHFECDDDDGRVVADRKRLERRGFIELMKDAVAEFMPAEVKN